MTLLDCISVVKASQYVIYYIFIMCTVYAAGASGSGSGSAAGGSGSGSGSAAGGCTLGDKQKCFHVARVFMERRLPK